MTRKKTPSTSGTKGPAAPKKKASKKKTTGKSKGTSKKTASKKKGGQKRNNNPDWDAIEREYRSPFKSQSQIAREFNVSEAAISKKAKREGWKRGSLKDAIRGAALEKNVKQATASQSDVKNQTAPAMDAAVVEKYSGLIAEILGDHQDLAKTLRLSSRRLVEQLELALLEIEPAIEDAIVRRNAAVDEQRKRKRLRKSERRLHPYTRAELLRLRLELLHKIVNIKQKTVQPLDRLIQLERQSYGLQDDDGRAIDDDLNYDTLLRDLHGVT